MSKNQKTVILFDVAGTLCASKSWGLLIQELRDKNYTIGVCTSGELDVYDLNHLASQGIDQKTDPVFLHANKNFADYYPHCLAAELKVSVNDIVLIDDGQDGADENNNRNVRAAFAAGAKGIHFDRHSDNSIEKVRQKLVDFELLS